jgi:hypothetical protein
MDSLNIDGFGPDRRGDTDLGLAGKKGRDPGTPVLDEPRSFTHRCLPMDALIKRHFPPAGLLTNRSSKCLNPFPPESVM